jgi:hypothetical protein
MNWRTRSYPVQYSTMINYQKRYYRGVIFIFDKIVNILFSLITKKSLVLIATKFTLKLL